VEPVFHFMKLTCSNKNNTLTPTIVVALLITAFLLLSMLLHLLSQNHTNGVWVTGNTKVDGFHQ
jgi:hypothetical protein